jgi:hypothetical protein
VKLRLIALSASLALFACAPEQPEVTRGCDSISECPLGDVCDRDLSECVPEPKNRFLGAFQCTVGIGPEVQELSEVVGNIDGDRWVLPGSLCWISTLQNTNTNVLSLGFHSPLGAGSLQVFLGLDALSDRRADIGPATGEGLDWASLENFETFTAFGYSRTGSVEFSKVPAFGDTIKGYIDIDMIGTARDDALWGAPCPRGLADCGDKTSAASGVAVCANVLNGPVCTSSCLTGGNGACSVDDGVCVQGLCTKPCLSHEDCDGGLRCVEGNPGEANGCF